MTITPLDRQKIAQAFDRAARDYDEYAVLQREVESRLIERVGYFGLQPERVLDLGCGTGSGSLALTRAFPDAQVVSLDWSGNMLQQTQSRLMNQGNPCAPVRADMHQLPLASRRFDLVFSSLAIQWSTTEPALFNEVLRVLKPGGLFLFSSFGPDTLHELRSAWAEVDDLPHVNEFVDLRDVGDALVSAGFMDPVMDMEHLVLEYKDVMTLMRELKAIGAHNVASDRSAGLTGKSKLKAMLAAYEAFHRDDRYPATYEVVYGATFGPPEGQPVRTPSGEIASVSVDALLDKLRSQ